jgi:hypothetical protein
MYYNDAVKLYKIFKIITHIDNNIFRLNKNYKDIYSVDIINNIGSNNFIELIENGVIKKTNSENLINRFNKLKSNIKNGLIQKENNSFCLGFTYLYFRLNEKPTHKNFIKFDNKPIKIKIDFIYL